MDVTNITVTRSRKVSPEQYGSADASLTVVAGLAEGEDWTAAARQLLSDTRALVYENLGLRLPAGATKPAQETATVETAPAASAAPASNEVPDDGKPRGRGRPKGSGKKTADVPDEPAPQIRTNPEDRKDPAESEVPDDTTAPAKAAAPVANDVPDDTAAPAKAAAPAAPAAPAAEDPIGSYSTGDLQSHLTALVKDKKISAQRVREIIASHGVARTSDLPADKVMLVKQQIDKEVTG